MAFERSTTRGTAFATAVLSGVLASAATAQDLEFAALRTAALKAMGGQAVERIELTGAGWDACLGQAWKMTEGWARWEIRDYRRVIDYGAGTSVQSATRRAALDPDRVGGCGAQPGAAATSQQTSLAADARWVDQLPIWLTPHGFLELGRRGTPVVARNGSGWTVTISVAREGMEYTLRGSYDARFLLQHIRTQMDDPIFGDMEVEAEFRDYRRFGDLTFPASLVQKQGGLATLDLTIDGVVPNTQASATPPPGGRGGRGAAGGRGGAPGLPPSQAPPYSAIGRGVFVLRGAYQAVAVEFEDFSVLIDGMQSDARVRELIRLTREAIPGKPIRYAVNTHSHFDHASGLRLLAAEGATVLTHEINVPFFERALNTPRTLSGEPARGGPAGAAAVRVQGVGRRFVINDGAGQTIELHQLDAGPHAGDVLIAYLPSIKTVVESDLLQPWINPVFGGGRDGPHPYLVYLFEELERLGLDYERFVPIHQPDDPPTMSKAALIEAVRR